MRKDKLLQLADILESNDGLAPFNIRAHETCIMGWANRAFNIVHGETIASRDFAHYMGLDVEDNRFRRLVALEITYRDGDNEYYARLPHTASEAADGLRRFIRGEEPWALEIIE